MPKITNKTLVRICVLAFFVCAILQSVGQSWFAGITLWGANIGWQTEISIWNVGMLLVLIPISKNENTARAVIPALMVLSLLFGANHLQAFIRADRFMLGNLMGFVSNFLMVALGIYSLTREKTK